MDRAQFEKFHKALQSAFPNPTSLRMLIRMGLGEHPESIIGGNNVSQSAFELIEWAEAQGRTEELIQKAHETNPNNLELRRFVLDRQQDAGGTQPQMSESLRQSQLLNPPLAPEASAIRENPNGQSSVAFAPFLDQLSPRQPSIFFTGRQEVLDALTAAFVKHSAVALSGIGGMGKTQVSLQYAAIHSQDYDHVFFVNADSRETLQSSYADIARQLNLLPKEVSDLTLIAETVLKWLRHTPGWLLLADNADNLNAVRDLLPFQGKGHLLLTTREAVIGGLGHLIRLLPLSSEEGAVLLMHRAHFLHTTEAFEELDAVVQEDAVKLSQQLGGLPLALEQAASYLEVMQLSPGEYLTLYKENAPELLAHAIYNSFDAHVPADITFKVNFEEIEQRSPAAADLLRFCSLLASDPIPEEIFTTGAGYLGEILTPYLPQRLHELIREAGRFSLLSRDPQNRNLLMHNIVQQVIRQEMDEVAFGRWMDRVVRVLDTNLLDPEFTTWSLYERLLPHVLVCATYIDRTGIETEEAAHLLHQVSWYLENRAQNAQAELLMKKALEIRERILGAEHHDTAKSLVNLAGLYESTGRYAQVEPLYERSLAIREKVSGPEHPDTATALNNLAFLYQATGRYAQAEPLYERSLAVREKVSGPEHPDTATALNNLAGLYQATGRYAQAGPLFKRALATYRRMFGLKNTKTRAICQQYVMCLQKQGRLREAREAAKRC